MLLMDGPIWLWHSHAILPTSCKSLWCNSGITVRDTTNLMDLRRLYRTELRFDTRTSTKHKAQKEEDRLQWTGNCSCFVNWLLHYCQFAF